METTIKKGNATQLYFAAMQSTGAKPASNEQPENMAKKYVRPFVNIDRRSMIVHNVGPKNETNIKARYRIYLNNEISQRAYDQGFKFAYLLKYKESLSLVLSNYNPFEGSKKVAHIVFNKHNRHISATINSKHIIKQICKFFGEKKNRFVVTIDITFSFNDSMTMGLCFKKEKQAEEVAPDSKPTTSTPKPTLSQFTDKELYEELKRRGWSGKLTKNDTLE